MTMAVCDWVYSGFCGEAVSDRLFFVVEQPAVSDRFSTLGKFIGKLLWTQAKL
jgi:hypothetical protein